MKIPKKITPDNLKDTIVQVLYEPSCYSELLLGLFYKIFNEKYKFVTESNVNQNLNFFSQTSQAYFVDQSDNIKITINDNNITFNSLKEYHGWNNFFPIIEETIKTIEKEKLVKQFLRIGVRYISQFNNIAIFDNIKMNLSFPISEDLFQTKFRTEFKSNSFKIILNLLNKMKHKENEFVSIVDIDILKHFQLGVVTKEVLETIDLAHKKQKETFFSLLTDEYLKTLNPEY